MDFITGMFRAMFKTSASRYKMRAEAKVRAATVGKVQAKALKVRTNVDRSVNKAQDSVFNVGKKKGGPVGPGAKGAAKGGAAAPAAAAGGAAPAAGAPAAGAPAGAGAMPGRPPVGPPPKQQQGAMGKGKQNKGQMPMAQMVACGNCGSGLQADWDLCPYCGCAVGRAAAAAAPVGPQPRSQQQPPADADKTMAINLEDLGKRQARPVVGWIVAQNGSHRGQDFRLYDGKNLLGTAADCDIVITDPYLSAKHCTIRHENGNFVLIDLDSTNGCFVNQKRISTMELIDNDTVRLGQTEFKFKALF
ncbi:MAG: FHA domain-containing protein [Myxococcota bacterium]|jgi:hypothetical protein|nr:FHA domain-containing protein [Myxococcota bacterium]